MMSVASVLVSEISGSLLMMFFTLVIGSWQLCRDDTLLPTTGAAISEAIQIMINWWNGKGQILADFLPALICWDSSLAADV